MERIERPVNHYRPLPAEITALKDETDDVRTYTLRLADGGTYTFAPGQFNMVSLPGIGEAAISLSSDPGNQDNVSKGVFQHTVRAVGNVTKALARLGTGDRLWVRGPYGNGWPMEAVKGDLLVVAGGVGLAPLRPVILRWLMDPKGKLVVLYGARSPGDMLYRDEFESWQNQGARLLLTVDKETEGTGNYRVGLVTDLLDDIEVSPGQSQAFICGPEIMMKFVVKGLLERDWQRQNIFVSLERRMECGFKICGRCQLDKIYVCQDGPVLPYTVVENLLGIDM